MNIVEEYLKTFIASLQKKAPIFLPTENFCVRKTTAVYAENKYWIYADIIPWNHQYWPDTYDTSIHAFSSPDGNKWTYHGEVIRHREASRWDYGGVATPGAVYFNKKIYIFYSGRQKTSGKGWRQIGMAVADNPAGPFTKADSPVIPSNNADCHLDDPIPIISSDGKNIELYYREAARHLPPPNYRICKTDSNDGGKTWAEPITILQSDTTNRAYETLDVMHIKGKTVLVTFDHFEKGGLKTAFRISNKNNIFNANADFYLEDELPDEWTRPLCAFNIMFMHDNEQYTHIGITREIDAKKHYNMAIYPIK